MSCLGIALYANDVIGKIDNIMIGDEMSIQKEIYSGIYTRHNLPHPILSPHTVSVPPGSF